MKYKKGLTSIIMPAWIPKGSDKKQYIKWTLDSLAKVTDKPFEMIIFDNQTTKDSEKFLKGFEQQFLKNKHCKGFKVLMHTKNMGWTGAIQIGIEESIGEYVNFTNDDLVFEDKWLSKMLKHFKPNTAAVGPTSNFVSGLQDIRYNKKGDYEEKVNFLIGFCMLLKRSALDDIIRGPDQYYIDPKFFPGGSEEIDVCLRLSKMGYNMYIAKDVFIHHFGSRSLKYFGEYNETNPMAFFQPRLDILKEKHGEDAMKVLGIQHCPKVALGIPTIGQSDSLFLADYGWVLHDAWSNLGLNNVLPIISPRNVVHIGRAEVVKKAIMYGAEYLMFLDDDMLPPYDIISRLYNYQKDYISGIAYKRNEPYFPCIFTGKNKSGVWMPDTRLKQGLIKVDITGLSCAMIKMDIIKNLISKLGDEKIKKRGGLFYFNRYGEDFNFTEELKKNGIDIFVDSNMIVDHLGRRLKVNDQTYLSYTKQQEALKEMRLQKGRNNNKPN